MNIGELCEMAFLAGYCHGVKNFAVWKDGQQLVGALQKPLEEILATAIDDVGEDYKKFLDLMKRRHEFVGTPEEASGVEAVPMSGHEDRFRKKQAILGHSTKHNFLSELVKASLADKKTSGKLYIKGV